MFDTLSWLGLTWDEGPADVGGLRALSPERAPRHLPALRRSTVESGHAYHCWCTPGRLAQMREAQARDKKPTGYDRMCHGLTEQERAELPGFSETPVVRMFVPDDVPLVFDDLIRGAVSAPRPDDQVIFKADGFPATTWLSSSTTTRWASPTSCAVRVDLLDAQAHPALPVARAGTVLSSTHPSASQVRTLGKLSSSVVITKEC